MCRMMSWTTEKSSTATETNAFGVKSEKDVSIKRNFKPVWTMVVDDVIRVIIAIGFVVSLCILSCSVSKSALSDVNGDVKKCKSKLCDVSAELGCVKEQLNMTSNLLETINQRGLVLSNSFLRLEGLLNRSWETNCCPCRCVWRWL